MNRKYKSGATKRKLKKDEEERKAKVIGKIRKLDEFMKPKAAADDANDNQLLNLPQNSGSSVSSPPPDENLVAVNVVNEIAEAKDQYSSDENHLHQPSSPNNDHLIANENIVIGSSTEATSTEATSDENLVTMAVDENAESSSSLTLPDIDTSSTLTGMASFSHDSDPVHYIKINYFTTALLQKFTKLDSCQPQARDMPDGAFPKSGQGQRSFSDIHYFVRMPDRSYARRKWLSYSVVLDKVFCFTCCLFGSAAAKNSFFVKQGTQNWANISHLLRVHETSANHLESEIGRSLFLASNRNLDSYRDRSANTRISQNREVVKVLINIVYFLAKHNLPLRGKVETLRLAGKSNLGNFIDMAILISKYHPTLFNFLLQIEKKMKDDEPSRVARVTFMSNRMQNSMLKILAEEIRSDILKEVKDAQYFSIIIDTTTDISKQEQFSMVIRYARVNYEKNEVEIVESLIALEICTDATSNGMFILFKGLCEKHGIDWRKNLVGQAYDGASSMRGQYGGLRTLVQNENPRAIYVWCYAHVLNLVIVSLCDSTQDIRNFFGNVQKLVNFIRSSRKRFQIFKDAQKASERLPKNARIRSLPSFSTTRWTSHHRSLDCIYECYDELMEALETIRDTDVDREATFEAGVYLSQMGSFSFVLILLVLIDIFKITTPLSKYLQSTNIDFVQAIGFVNMAIDSLNEMRTEEKYKWYCQKATEFGEQRGITLEILQKRIPRKKRYLAEETGKDERPQTEEDRFRVETYLPMFDNIITSMKDRFSKNVGNILQSCCYLSEERLKQLFQNENDGSNEQKEIFEPIKNWLGLEFSNQIIIDEFRIFHQHLSTLKKQAEFPKQEGVDADTETESATASATDTDDEEGSSQISVNSNQSLSVLQIFKLIAKYDLRSVFPIVYTIYKAVCTLPVSSASAERSFSKVNIIKSKARSTMGEERLESLLLISCEGAATLEEDTINRALDKLSASSQDLRRELCYD